MGKRLDLKGYVVHDDDLWVYDYFEIGAFSHKTVKNFLAEAGGEDVDLYIDSPGGLLRVASDIYSELRSYEGVVTAYVIGLSASASSVLMEGATKVVAHPAARIMIHPASAGAQGDYREMNKAARILKNADESIINVYQLKTGMERDQLRALMDEETWMTAQEALAYGFIDEIALKEGEALPDIQIAASLGMPVAGRPQIAVVNMDRLHSIAEKFKSPENLESETIDVSALLNSTEVISGDLDISDADKKSFYPGSK